MKWNPLLSILEQRMPEPTARGLATAAGRAISDGVLNHGDKLPPIRTVATQLGLSPTTVSSAWTRLARAGTIHTDGRRGTTIVVRHVGPTRYRGALTRGKLFTLDLSTGTPDPDLLPEIVGTLRRIEPPPEPATYLDEPVLPELRELLEESWPFSAERITVVDGAMDALQAIVATHLRVGDRVAVEDPCFPPLLDLLDAAGLHPVPVSIDDDGPQPASLAAALDAGIDALFIQPHGQNPTGASLTPQRVVELAQVLRDSAVLVVEDDSFAATDPSSTPSLGSELSEHLLHVRSFSKTHGPDLRLAAIGGPATLLDPIVDHRFLGQGWTSRLLQRILVDLLTHAPSMAAVEQARQEYARRRGTLVELLRAANIAVGGKDGLNVWIPVADEATALLVLATHGIAAAAGRPFMVRDDHQPHIRVTTAMLNTSHPEVATALVEAAHAGPRSIRH